MAQARITVTVPTYNRATLLRETIDSILNQTYENFVVLIADNASTDETHEMVAKYRDSRIVYHRHQENLGWQRNWRFCLTQPQTELVSFVSDDDIFAPEHLARAVEQLDSHRDISMYGCAVEIFPGAAGRMMRPLWPHENREPVVVRPQQEILSMLYGVSVQAASWVLRRPVVDKVTLWGASHYPQCVDWLWQGQMFMEGGLLYEPRAFVRYRVHEKSVTGQWKKKAGVMAVEDRYVIRELATLAYSRGLLAPERLVRDLQAFPAVYAAKVMLALAAPEAPEPLRRAALEAYAAHPTIRRERASQHIRLARVLGKWYLKWADRLQRRRVGWPPKSPGL